jgi:hypothetical protein
MGFGLGGGECKDCMTLDPNSHALLHRKSNDGVCWIALCETKYHLDGNTCVLDRDNDEGQTSACVIDHGAGFREWENKNGIWGWGGCKVESCDAGYHKEGNACAPDKKPCDITGKDGNIVGNGGMEWNAEWGRWGECVPEKCNLGYTSDKSLTNEWSVPCGRCKNYLGGDGEPAVSTWSLVAGAPDCAIGFCMYEGEKYKFEDGECIPICERRKDETGEITGFNPVTKTCDRSSCEAGYKPWEKGY